MALRAGQKVVCVRDGWDRGPIHLVTQQKPETGMEYIIRSVGPTDDGTIGYALRFCWLIGPTTSNGTECTWGSHGFDGKPNFRLVTETKTDISVFTEILARETIKDDKPIKVRSL